jgi:hypothetical protein
MNNRTRLRPVLAPIAAASGPDCGYGSQRERHQPHNLKLCRAAFATGSPHAGHTEAALARTASLFRFASVASRPRFSHDPVNLAPDCDG